MTENNVLEINGSPSRTHGGGAGGGGGGELYERLTRLEEKVRHLPTSKDISDIKELMMKNHNETKDISNKTHVEMEKNEKEMVKTQLQNFKWFIGLFILTVSAIVGSGLLIK